MGCTGRAYGPGRTGRGGGQGDGQGDGQGIRQGPHHRDRVLRRSGRRATFPAVATVSADLTLHPLGGEPRTAAEQVNLFQLVVVAIDPYTNESAWLLETAGRLLTEFSGADCRVAFLVTAPEEDARTFLGPWADRVMVFCDPERTAVEALGIEQIPSLVHVGHDLTVVGAAQGWDPDTWRPVLDNLSAMMSWSRPALPRPGDPGAFAGSPAKG